MNEQNINTTVVGKKQVQKLYGYLFPPPPGAYWEALGINATKTGTFSGCFILIFKIFFKFNKSPDQIKS